MGSSIDFEMKDKREAPEVITQGEGTPTTSTSSPASTSESVGVSSGLTHPSTSATASGMVLVSGVVL